MSVACQIKGTLLGWLFTDFLRPAGSVKLTLQGSLVAKTTNDLLATLCAPPGRNRAGRPDSCNASISQGRVVLEMQSNYLRVQKAASNEKADWDISLRKLVL